MYDFNGTLHFETVNDLLTPSAALARMKKKIEPYNGPFLAGKATEPPHEYGRLPETQPALPADWSSEDDQKVIGDLKESLKDGSAILIARTSELAEAERIAKKLGYRPALPGEFLQLLDWTQTMEPPTWHGWHYCYAGRSPNYAILGSLWTTSGPVDVLFDTYLPDKAEVESNSDNNFYFVREEE